MTKHVIGTNSKGYLVGEYHHRARLSDDQVEQLRSTREEKGTSYAELAKMFGISKSSVRDLVTYQRRGQIYERWKDGKANKEPKRPRGGEK